MISSNGNDAPFMSAGANLYPSDYMQGLSHQHSPSVSSTLLDNYHHSMYQGGVPPLPMPIGLTPSAYSSALPSPAVTSAKPPIISPPTADYKYTKFSGINLSPTDDIAKDMSKIHLGPTGRADSFPPSPGSRFLFDNGPGGGDLTPPPSTHKRLPSYLQAETTDDKFPILVRRESNNIPSTAVNTPRASVGFGQETVFDMLDPSPILIENATWSNVLPPVSLSNHQRGSNGGSRGLGLTAFSSSGIAVNGYLSNAATAGDLEPSTIYSSDPSIDQQQSKVKAGSNSYFDITPPGTQSPSSVYRNSYFVPYNNQLTANTTGLHLRSDSGSQIAPPTTTAQPEVCGSLMNTAVSAGPLSSQSSFRLTPQTSAGGAHHVTKSPGQNNHMSSAKPVRENNRRQNSKRGSDQDSGRFSQANLENLAHEVYSLCKDQHGCRFLQKKLEERNPTYLNIIFNETCPHVVELMTDPFGNYLCQKLLEHASDEQRTALIRAAVPSLVKIAVNQHGTRALQKMIEYVSTPEQVEMIVNALKANVVKLIKDLNGNHVVQKCLNRLRSDGSQFIFDAVSKNCVIVGTHRHGCCVLQRCIDHASDAQRRQLVKEIIANAFTLVQDPFGNYVAQYVLDLGSKEFSEPLIRQFVGNACVLSMQKFSSNVIEKCLRIADPETANLLIEELVDSPYLDKLLRDSYANYVIQTALDYAEAGTRQRLVDNIRPIIPSIRSTPYGRRIQSKLSAPVTQNSSEQNNSNQPHLTPQPYPGMGLLDWNANPPSVFNKLT